ncbi:tetratricopeptide repeat protein [Desulfovibrio sp. OttesenSCG-928-I05]|nr:tetratricopeptide repeat protein [Desulfovibrio sp. OttesenSCG-928-I05]
MTFSLPTFSVPGFCSPTRFARPLLVAALCAGLYGCSMHGRQAEWDLTPGARQVYSYLVLQDAITRNDPVMVLQTIDELQSIDPDVQIFRDGADYFLLRRELDTSKSVATQGLALYPNDVTLYQILTEGFIQGGKFAEAEQALEEFSAAVPGNYDAIQELARVQILRQHFKNAEKTLARIPERHKTPTAHYLKAMALLGQDKIVQGERELARVVAEDPQFSDAWINMAMAAQTQGEYTKAAEIYRKALHYDAGNLSLWLRLVDVYIKAGKSARAVKALSEAPSVPALHLEAAALFIDAGDYKSADAILAPFRDVPGVPDEVYFYLAAVELDHKKNPEEALRLLSRVSLRSRLAERALLWRLEILTDEKRSEEALLLARENIAAHPDQPTPYMTAATTASRLGMRDVALSFLRQGLEAFPGHGAISYHLASLLDLNGEKDEALRLMEALVEREPGNALALNYVGYSLADENRDLDRAHTLLVRAVAEAPDDPHIADSLAWVLYRMERYAEAWDAIQRSITLGGDHAVIWEHYGDIAAKLGNSAEARRGYTKAMKSSPDNPGDIQAKLNAL